MPDSLVVSMLRMRTPLFATALLLGLCTTSTSGWADSSGSRLTIGLEAGGVRFARNDVRLPGDTGTRFDMTELTGANAGPLARLNVHWRVASRHELRFALAPLAVSGTGMLEQEATFDDTTFPAGSTEGSYQFSAYKLTYRYALPERGRWRLGVGFTAVIRDAKIELRQGASVATNTNVGFVPALHLSGDYRLSDRWSFRFDIDGLAGGPGRLLDLGAKLDFSLTESWQIGGGYRTVEGGADTDDLFTFAWINYALLDLRYRF